MIRLTFIAAALAALVLPAAASAKGPSEGSISGTYEPRWVAT